MAELTEAALADALPGRAVRVYPALLSTAAEALAWARASAPEGAVVVAGYQASPRGRAGLEWSVRPGVDLCFSLVLRPTLPPEHEGWLYIAASCGLADVLDARVRWPDAAGDARVGLHAELGPDGIESAVLNVLVPDAPLPHAAALARVVEAVEARYRSPATPVLADYLRRCETLGERVRARMIPLGPGGVEFTGRAATVNRDGALVLELDDERRIAVRPQNLGLLDSLKP